MFEGTDPTLWVFVGVMVLAAVVFGVLLDVGTAVTSYLRSRERQRKASSTERITAVEQLVGSAGYGRHAVADPDKTQPIPPGYTNAGSELPQREGVVFGQPVLPDVPPRREDLGQVAAAERHDPAVARAAVAAVDLAQRDAAAALSAVRAGEEPAVDSSDGRPDDDRRDDPPAGGGPTGPGTLVMPRYAWAHLNGEQLDKPGPWRAPIESLFHALARFRRRRPDVALLWSALALLPSLRHWLFRMLVASYRSGRHAARRGVESWDDTRALLSARWHQERQEASRNTQELILNARQSSQTAFPAMRCVPR